MNAPITRGDWLEAIQSEIQRFNADVYDASDILSVLIRTLKDRYDASLLRDIEHEAEQLKEALQALHEEPTEQDWREMRADQEPQYEEEEQHG